MLRLPLFALTAAALLCVGFNAPRAQASDPQALVPDKPAWVIQMHMSRLMDSAFGKQMWKMLAQEMPDKLDKYEAMTDALGMDPMRDTGEAIIYGTGFKRSDAHIAVDLGKHAGNIEGLLIAAPGYESAPYGKDVLIHSVPSDDAARVDPDAKRLYMAMLPHPESKRWLMVASHKEAGVKSMVDKVRDAHVLTTEPLEGKTFMRATMLEKPAKMPGGERGPHSNIAAMIDRLDMTGEAGDELTLGMTAKVVDHLRARQLAQLIQGGIAMVQLAADDNPKAQQLADVLSNMTVRHKDGEDTVRAELSYSAEELMALRPDRLDL